MGLLLLRALLIAASGALGAEASKGDKPDEFCLIQAQTVSQTTEVQELHGALAAPASRPARTEDSVKALQNMHRKLGSAIKNLLPKTVPLPDGVKPAADFIPLGGFTMGETLQMGMELLSYFTHNETVDAIYYGLRDLSNQMGRQAVTLGLRARNLYWGTKNPTTSSVEDVFDKLEEFFRSNLLDLSQIVALTLNSLATTLATAPDGFIKNMSAPYRSMMGSLTKDKVFNGLLWPPTQQLMRNRTYFCHNFNPVYWHIVDLDKAVTLVTRTYVPQAKVLLPSIMAQVNSMAPHLAGEVTEFINVTLEYFDEIMSGYNISVHLLMEALYEVSTYRLGCDWIRPQGDESAAFKAAPLGWLLPLLTFMLFALRQ